jgi:hypothetical protein
MKCPVVENGDNHIKELLFPMPKEIEYIKSRKGKCPTNPANKRKIARGLI